MVEAVPVEWCQSSRYGIEAAFGRTRLLQSQPKRQSKACHFEVFSSLRLLTGRAQLRCRGSLFLVPGLFQTQFLRCQRRSPLLADVRSLHYGVRSLTVAERR